MKTPELDKMLAVKDDSQKIGEFVKWLNTQEISLCKCYDTDEANDMDYGDIQEIFMPIHKRTEQLLADYFKIDLDKCEQERQGLLAELRK